MSAPFQKFNCFMGDLGNKLHNLSSDTFYIGLTNTAPVATNTVYSNISDIGTGNGYTAGGTSVPSTAWSGSAGVWTFSAANTVFTASGGSIGPFRYAVLYNYTASGNNLVGWWDYGSSISIAASETFSIDPTSSDIFTAQ